MNEEKRKQDQTENWGVLWIKCDCYTKKTSWKDWCISFKLELATRLQSTAYPQHLNFSSLPIQNISKFPNLVHSPIFECSQVLWVYIPFQITNFQSISNFHFFTFPSLSATVQYMKLQRNSPQQQFWRWHDNKCRS